uniref:VWFA domain-containing protein n=1 Tax=Parascaris univalens TaxID=6257 RepID=A0A915AMU3_PARUN
LFIVHQLYISEKFSCSASRNIRSQFLIFPSLCRSGDISERLFEKQTF